MILKNAERTLRIWDIRPCLKRLDWTSPEITQISEFVYQLKNSKKKHTIEDKLRMCKALGLGEKIMKGIKLTANSNRLVGSLEGVVSLGIALLIEMSTKPEETTIWTYLFPSLIIADGLARYISALYVERYAKKYLINSS